MILALETSSLICGASLHENGELIAEVHLKEARVHAERLVGLVDQLFTEQKIRVPKLKAVVVSAGPGSFTGLRIGMSFAKGLVYPHGIALAGVNTMKAYMHSTLSKADLGKKPLWVIRSHKDYIYAAEYNDPIHEIEIRYGQIKDIAEWYPQCGQIICNDDLPEIEEIPIIEEDIMASMMAEYYLAYKNESANTDYDSLVLEYGMDYKPKEWKPVSS